MAWTAPRTWVAGESQTSSMYNTHVSANFTVLKTHIANDGWPLTGVKLFAAQSGIGNAAGGGDTQLTAVDTTIPAYLLELPGDCIVVEMMWSCGSASEVTTGKVQIGSGTTVTYFSSNLPNTLRYSRVLIRRRTQTTGALQGVVFSGAAGGGSPSAYYKNEALSSIDWHTSQTLKHFAASNTANNLRLWYLQVHVQKSKTGALV